MELDHVFVMISDGVRQHRALEALGLVETYRRIHPGQGTKNICYAFENAFLELLWVHDEHEARSKAIRRTLLWERSTGLANPFGISWRGTADVQTWDYTPPYMTKGAIPVSIDSDSPDQPLMFRTPGLASPKDWPQEKQKGLQSAAGLTQISDVRVSARPSKTLSALENAGILNRLPEQPAPALELICSGPAREISLTLPGDLTPP
ncbi:MAG: VOC family protein [Myxococcota bacterium]